LFSLSKPTPWTATTFGWESCAAVRASRKNFATYSRLAARAGSMIFSAMRRSRLTSFAS
jgi:hypothetical protein